MDQTTAGLEAVCNALGSLAITHDAPNSAEDLQEMLSAEGLTAVPLYHGLRALEVGIFRTLESATATFGQLTSEHPGEHAEFNRLVRSAQDLILARSARRAMEANPSGNAA